MFLAVLARVAGFIGAIPVFSSTQSSMRWRIGLIVTTTLVLFPVMSLNLLQVSFQPVPFSLFVVNEILLGALIGLAARLIFTAVEFGATVAGYQMGFAAANVFDPSAQRQIALLSQFHNVFAIMIFFWPLMDIIFFFNWLFIRIRSFSQAIWISVVRLCLI